MRNLLMLVGIVAFLAGVLFAGQGAGYIHWPASSTMINDMNWVYYGCALAVVGLLLILYGRRRGDMRG